MAEKFIKKRINNRMTMQDRGMRKDPQWRGIHKKYIRLGKEHVYK